MWCISMALQVIVELVPWAIKRLVGVLRPHSTEVLRMRLAVCIEIYTCNDTMITDNNNNYS